MMKSLVGNVSSLLATTFGVMEPIHVHYEFPGWQGEIDAWGRFVESVPDHVPAAAGTTTSKAAEVLTGLVVRWDDPVRQQKHLKEVKSYRVLQPGDAKHPGFNIEFYWWHWWYCLCMCCWFFTWWVAFWFVGWGTLFWRGERKTKKKVQGKKEQ